MTRFRPQHIDPPAVIAQATGGSYITVACRDCHHFWEGDKHYKQYRSPRIAFDSANIHISYNTHHTVDVIGSVGKEAKS